MTQEEALSILKTGANIFLTGEPGSGKTHTVNEYISWLRSHGIEPSITASTGIAATHVGGLTIHAWSGIGILSDLSQYDLDRIAATERIVRRVRHASVLIIDEISMLSSNTLSMVDAVCREIRSDTRAFGGLQVVFVGDFFQLPPITRRVPIRADDLMPQRGGEEFAFASHAWRLAKPLVCYLSEQHRQEDAGFLEVLSAIRRGEVTDEHRTFLEDRKTDDAIGDESLEDATKLFSHNADVDKMNEAALSKLSGISRRYAMDAKGQDHLIESLKRGCLSPEFLILKQGARVMFTKNDPVGRYANGTLGNVIGFASGGNPVVETVDGEEVIAEPVEWKMEDGGKLLARVTQVPLRLAWAITVHKSQGLSLDAAHIDLSRAFEFGQGYVALSRVRTREGLRLLGFNERALLVHPVIQERDADFREESGAAQRAFAQIESDELADMQKNFIRAMGGAEKTLSKKEQEKPAVAREKDKREELLLELLKEKKSLAQIAKERERTVGTILEHLEGLLQSKKIHAKDLSYLKKGVEKHIQKAQDLLETSEDGRLKTIYEALGGKVSYDTIRLARLLMT